jgi:hypothetical protein
MTIFFVMIIPINGISQDKILPSLELGFTFSQFPSKNLVVTWQISDSTETRTSPLVGPVIGISSKLHLMKKLQLLYGFNYQILKPILTVIGQILIFTLVHSLNIGKLLKFTKLLYLLR